MMRDFQAPLPEPSTAHDELRLSDLTSVVGTCFASDPGPDPTYDPDEIPPDMAADD
jgi:hypothetical protein